MFKAEEIKRKACQNYFLGEEEVRFLMPGASVMG